MKKLTKKIFAVALALVCVFAVLAPASVQAATKPSVPKSATVYLRGKNSGGYSSIYIGDLKANSKITNVKSANKKYCTPYAVRTYFNNYENLYNKEYGYSDYYGYIYFDVFKAGKTKLTYKIDKKPYSTAVNILAYENPIKIAKITGKVKGKAATLNLSSKTKTAAYNHIVNKKTYEDAKITIQANKGWKISYIQSYDSGESVNVSKSVNGANKVTLKFGDLTAKKYGYIMVNMYNEITGGTMTVEYGFN